MTKILAGDRWVERDDTNGKMVADLLTELTHDNVITHMENYTVKADGIVLSAADTIGEQEVLEVIQFVPAYDPDPDAPSPGFPEEVATTQDIGKSDEERESDRDEDNS